MCCQLQPMMWGLVFLSADGWRHSCHTKAAQPQNLVQTSTYGLPCYDHASVRAHYYWALIDEVDSYAYLRKKFCSLQDGWISICESFLKGIKSVGMKQSLILHNLFCVVSHVPQIDAGCSTVDLRSGFEEDEKETKWSILGFLRVCFPYWVAKEDHNAWCIGSPSSSIQIRSLYLSQRARAMTLGLKV